MNNGFAHVGSRVVMEAKSAVECGEVTLRIFGRLVMRVGRAELGACVARYRLKRASDNASRVLS